MEGDWRLFVWQMLKKNIWHFAPRTQHMLQWQHRNASYLKGCIKDNTWNLVWIIVKRNLLFPSHRSLNPQTIKFSAKLSFFQGTAAFSWPGFERQLFIQICNVRCGGRCWVEFGRQGRSLSVGSRSRPKQALNPKDAILKQLIMATEVFPLERGRLAEEQLWLSRICCTLLYLKGIRLRDCVSESHACLQPSVDSRLSSLLCLLVMLLWTWWLQPSLQLQIYN